MNFDNEYFTTKKYLKGIVTVYYTLCNKYSV